MRRNLPLVYIIEDNGVYGLTKGQFSATADLGAKQKGGAVNDFIPIDCCSLAIELGGTFVARSFSGDMKQLQTILEAAIAHKGTSVIDVISPCVTFNDHEGSTKSYKYSKEHETPVHEIGFVPFFEETLAEIPAGDAKDVAFPDGSVLRFRGVGRDYDPTDKEKALKTDPREPREAGDPHGHPLRRPVEAGPLGRCSARPRSRSRPCPSRSCGLAARRSTRSWSRSVRRLGF